MRQKDRERQRETERDRERQREPEKETETFFTSCSVGLPFEPKNVRLTK